MELVLKITELAPPRRYRVGKHNQVEIADCARIDLAADEQVTFRTAAGAEYDVTRKDWGFYATPSLNGRLSDFGLRGVLVRNTQGRMFVLLVERTHETSFQRYVEEEQLRIVAWLDGDVVDVEAALSR